MKDLSHDRKNIQADGRLHKEIGSEFWDAPVADFPNACFPDSTQWFLSGRSALQAIIKELKGVHSVALPSWCCDSMVKPFVDNGIKIQFYPVYWSNGLVQEYRLNCDALLLLDYFGYAAPSVSLNDYSGIVIRDVTHSFFSRQYHDAQYYFGSLRKWAGFWTGGIAWTQDGHRLTTDESGNHDYTSLRKKAMSYKKCYIFGTAGDRDAFEDKGYLRLFDEAETLLEEIGIGPAAERDTQLARMLDVDYIKARRRANALILRNAFRDWLVFPEMDGDDCPLFVPILVPDGFRDSLRNYLITHEIYCPVHWPKSIYHTLDSREAVLYDNELSLICDQRYFIRDMRRLVDTVEAFWEGKKGC